MNDIDVEEFDITIDNAPDMITALILYICQEEGAQGARLVVEAARDLVDSYELTSMSDMGVRN